MLFKSAYRYQLATNFKALLWFYLWGIAGIVVIPFAMWLMFDRTGAYSLQTALPQQLTVLVLGIFLIVYGANTYDGFKTMIQNGVGRKTYFWTKVLAMATIVVFGEFINGLYGLFYVSVVAPKNTTVFMFDYFYGRAFTSQFASEIVTIMIAALFGICVVVTAMFFGSILGLFSRRTQLILLVGIPILLVIIVISANSINLGNTWRLTWLNDVLNAITGSTGAQTQAGHFNPLGPLVSGTLYTVIMTLLTYRVNLMLKTPR